MKLQEQIKNDLVLAMKSKNIEIISLLRVVVSEFSTVASRMENNTDKILSDEQALKEIRKMVQNAIECGNKNEVEILNKYLPSMFDENQIRIIIEKIISDNNITGAQNMGKVMGEIKKHPDASKIDNKIASTIVKELLNR